MSSVSLIRTSWAGTTGGAGLTQLAVSELATLAPLDATEAQAAVNAVRAFWDSCKSYIPNEVTLTVSPVVDIYEIGDAVLSGSVTAATPPAAVVGTAAGAYSMAAGLKINLNTSNIAYGRRVRGAIFLVPSDAAASMNTSGLAASGAKTAINAAGVTLLAALATAGLDLNVYSRPNEAKARAGGVYVVDTLEVNDKTAILRGRRD